MVVEPLLFVRVLEVEKNWDFVKLQLDEILDDKPDWSNVTNRGLRLKRGLVVPDSLDLNLNIYDKEYKSKYMVHPGVNNVKDLNRGFLVERHEMVYGRLCILMYGG